MAMLGILGILDPEGFRRAVIRQVTPDILELLVA